MRRRYERFVEAIRRNGICRDRENEAVYTAWCNLILDEAGIGGSVVFTDKVAVRKVNKLLKEPDIVAAVGRAFTTAGISPAEAMSIVGEIARQREELPVALEAAKTVLRYTVPVAPQRVQQQVKTQSETIVRTITGDGTAPPMIARPVKAISRGAES